MKIQHINQQPHKNTNQQSFTGWGDLALRFLDTNQAWGATAVDFSCMVAPRTITDFTRGPAAGLETLRREASGTINHAATGLVYGPLAGMLLAAAVNSKYGIKAQNVYADSETINLLSRIQYETVHSNAVNLEKNYAENIAKIINSKDGRQLSGKAQKLFADVLENEIKSTQKFGIKLTKRNKARLRNIILSDLGSEELVLNSHGKKAVSSLHDVVENVTSLSKVMFKDKVIESFQKAANYTDVNFVKNMKNLGMHRSLLGLGIGAAIGCSIQPLNIYLTKKKTGSDGFVGVEGREKDKSGGFKLLKTGIATAFGTGVYGLITKNTWKFSNFLKNVQYKGLTPTIPQFMLVYGATIMSRFLAARDKDELREATVKDTLGFLSWLVFGNFVSKGVLKALDKDLAGKTRDEVLFGALKKAGISTIEKGKALRFSELLKKLPDTDIATKVKLRNFNIAQIAGYAFSAAVLGIGIPKLNIYMTNKSEQKRAHKRVLTGKTLMYKPENIAFLSKQMSFTSNKLLKE